MTKSSTGGSKGGRQSGDKVASIASKVLRGGKATAAEIKSLAGSVMSQDQTKGKRGK